MAKTSYIPMLLTCKLISEECLKSIYESITFVFTDLHSWQSFIGFCDQDARMKTWPKVDLQPQAFPKYCKHLELSMTPFFPCLITCSSPMRTPQPDRPHDPYDFHWLRLSLFQNLQSIKIWVTARSTKVLKGPNERGSWPDFIKITDLDIDELRQALSCFANVNEFVISTPLSNDIGPEDGLVEGVTTRPHHRVWKRGTGDFFHPRLSPNFGRGGLSGLIYTSTVRQLSFPLNYEYLPVDTSLPYWPELFDPMDDPAPGVALIKGPDPPPLINQPRDSLPDILVPLVEPIVPYDDADFSTFGERLGLTFDNADTATPEGTASILQSWLFFGLLSRSLKDSFRMDNFVKPSQKDRFLSLKNLPSDIDAEDSDFGEQLLKDCMDAAALIRRLDALGRLDKSPAGETGLAILVLVKALLTLAFKPSRQASHACKSLFKKAPLTKFWLDTLCIPVSTPGDSAEIKADVDKLKLLAINQMGQIYAAASQILVLDSELQQVGAGVLDQISHVESLARLVSCAWMRRCWTLQEGALANKITFQSAIGPMTPFLPPRITEESVAFSLLPGPFIYLRIYQLYKWEMTHRESVQERKDNPILVHLRYRFQEVLDNVTSTYNRSRFFGQATPASQLEVFSAVWNQLAYRNTTKKEDLPAIFSNLLDINVWKLLQHRPEDRMKALLRGTDALPIDLLFNTGPRALSGKDSLDRWVPSQPSRTIMRSSREAKDFEPDAIEEFFDEYVKNSLRWTESGDLELSPLNSKEMMALGLQGDEKKDASSLVFVTYIDMDLSGQVTPFLVRLHIPEVDELQRDDRHKEALILDVRDRSGGGGCLLRLTNIEEESHDLVGRYDCPLTWESVSPEDLASYPTVSSVDFGNPFKLTLQCEPGPVMKGQVKRPLHGHLMGTAKITGTLLMGTMKIFWLASFILRIIIEVRLAL
ncbi:hypothetical protein CDV36_006424 [Fusarium kuroshium]|uniref:Heterokaryon incompatibility domain-containing protein n=1 Tax=Fusarium kuroshium TaxID=2010991 RepID=A0A3M2S8R5_9HYPO|nr:hypothetical protein CDV36_006424 [Fusarium kuroshium]